jgi:hypothetical protein
MGNFRLGYGADGVLVMWTVRILGSCVAVFPVYALGRATMWLLMSKTQYEQVLLAGHTYSIWLGGWALLASLGFLVGLWAKGSLSKAVAAFCFGCLLGFWILGLGIGAGATAEVTMAPEDRQEALQDAQLTSHPRFWQVCCVRR